MEGQRDVTSEPRERPVGSTTEPVTPQATGRRPRLSETRARTQTALTTLQRWVEENQTVAMLSAFAAGVFMGVMMRR